MGLVPEPQAEPAIRGQIQAVQRALGPWASAERFLSLTETAQPSPQYLKHIRHADKAQRG